MDLNILTAVLLVVISILSIITVAKTIKAEKEKGFLTALIDCIPIIDKSITDFVNVYKASKSEEQTVALTVDFLYDIVSKNTTLDDKYPGIVNKDNIQKYLVPVFKKIYATELKK